MKKFYVAITALIVAVSANAQVTLSEYAYPPEVAPRVFVHSADLTSQVMLVGGVDTVQTTPTYGNPAGQALAKQWHDFVGFTPDNDSEDLGWVSVNHERIVADSLIGDGGGMTAFKITKDSAGMLVIVPQTLADGRSGKFFNVDFVNTVGNTGMNCGGITSVVDGRIWTAEEWFRSSNESIDDRDLDPFVIGIGTPSNPVSSNDFPEYTGTTIQKYQNYNYMVEIDPKEAVAIRKQYNWGRQPFEGGAVASDNKTVYLGADATPGYFTRFVADEAGDFTSGSISVYKHDGESSKWVEFDNSTMNNMLNFSDRATTAGATMYNRLEWVTYDPNTGKIYMTETGRDNPAGRWNDEHAEGAVYAPHHIMRATDQGTTVDNDAYWDYYGRVLVYDPETDEVSIFLEGGPFLADGMNIFDFNNIKHLSNPDGLATFVAGDNSYLMVQEDLNGTSFGRMPEGVSNRTCEFFLLDLNIENPTVDDLTRIAAVPAGAEVTGSVQVDANTILVNSQHPRTDNPAPFNNSLTMALHGLAAGVTTNIVELIDEEGVKINVQVYPNPVSQNLFFQESGANLTLSKIEVFDLQGRKVYEKAEGNSVNFSEWTNATYVLRAQKLNGTPVVTKVVKN